MGEKVYRPIIKDGDHLVRSRENPDRFRGQSRDENNKNPDIIEWEEVEQDDFFPDDAYEKEPSTADAFAIFADAIAKVATLLAEHPEIIHGVVKSFKWIRTKGSNLIARITGKPPRENAIATVDEKPVHSPIADSCDTPVVAISVENDDVEEMSLDDARILVLKILSSYISYKQGLNRLSKVRIKDAEVHQIENIDQVVLRIDTILDKYPELMDKKTSDYVLDMIQQKLDAEESERIAEVLGIPSRD